jgi:hypothetical protein
LLKESPRKKPKEGSNNEAYSVPEKVTNNKLSPMQEETFSPEETFLPGRNSSAVQEETFSGKVTSEN